MMTALAYIDYMIGRLRAAITGRRDRADAEPAPAPELRLDIWGVPYGLDLDFDGRTLTVTPLNGGPSQDFALDTAALAACADLRARSLDTGGHIRQRSLGFGENRNLNLEDILRGPLLSRPAGAELRPLVDVMHAAEKASR